MPSHSVTKKTLSNFSQVQSTVSLSVLLSVSSSKTKIKDPEIIRRCTAYPLVTSSSLMSHPPPKIRPIFTLAHPTPTGPISKNTESKPALEEDEAALAKPLVVWPQEPSPKSTSSSLTGSKSSLSFLPSGRFIYRPTFQLHPLHPEKRKMTRRKMP